METLLSELSDSVESLRALVLGRMNTKRDSVVTKGEGLVSRLEAELSQLVERRALMETQATSQDHIGFLQVETPHHPLHQGPWRGASPRGAPLRHPEGPLYVTPGGLSTSEASHRGLRVTCDPVVWYAGTCKS